MTENNSNEREGVYMGNVGSIYKTSPRLIRRSLMRQLLIRDHIVFSDSQMLTDPAIHALMGDQPEMEKDLKRHFAFERYPAWMEDSKLTDWQTGFERFLKEGLVRVAHRSKDGEPYSISRLWDNMHHYPNHVPHLPDATSDYPLYLDSVLQDCVRPAFDLDAITAKFQENLLSGITFEADEKRKCILDRESALERKLEELFHKKGIRFSDVHTFLDACLKDGESPLSEERYGELLNYANSCYSCNIPILLDCRICTEAGKLPLHLDCGTGDFKMSPETLEKCELRKTKALNPEILDYVPTDAFLELCRKLRQNSLYQRLQGFFDGVIEENQVDEFAKAWYEYVEFLELYLERHAYKKGYDVVKKLEKLDYLQPRPETFLGLPIGDSFTVEIVNVALGKALDAIPFGSYISDALDEKDAIENLYTTFSNRNMWATLKQRREEVETLLSLGVLKNDNLANAALGATAVVETRFNTLSQR